jgi:hypothetical protein
MFFASSNGNSFRANLIGLSDGCLAVSINVTSPGLAEDGSITRKDLGDSTLPLVRSLCLLKSSRFIFTSR